MKRRRNQKATPQDMADGFNRYAENITEVLNRFAYRQVNPELARLYITYQQMVEKWRELTRSVPGTAVLPELPRLPGNNFFAGMTNLADWCRDAAKCSQTPPPGELAGTKATRRKLFWSIVRRSALWLVMFAGLECLVVLGAWHWGEGRNLWQKCINSWPFFVAVFAASAIAYPFFLGRERLQLLKFWKGDDK